MSHVSAFRMFDTTWDEASRRRLWVPGACEVLSGRFEAPSGPFFPPACETKFCLPSNSPNSGQDQMPSPIIYSQITCTLLAGE